jgi:protocatechuate 3,4-dioxygenase beta subunit
VCSSRAALAIVLAGLAAGAAPRATAAPACPPTPEDMLGPFYEPGAPERSKVGTGHLLQGTVRSAGDCRPLPGARVELWLAGPRGYDDDHRATVVADEAGRYRFESPRPSPYERRPPHIHVRVAHPGHRTLVTQHYPAAGRSEATFDLVLAPAR